jgi:hypothetical protein
MKKLIVVLMLLALCGIVQAQPIVQKGLLFKTYTNFLYTSDDTTGWMSIPEINGVIASEWGIIGIASDSIQAVVNVVGRNSQIMSGTTYQLSDVYIDSISSLGAGVTAWAATNPKTAVIMLKDATVDRLEGCDQFKVGTVFGVAGSQGTTTGRYMKWYLWYQK